MTTDFLYFQNPFLYFKSVYLLDFSNLPDVVIHIYLPVIETALSIEKMSWEMLLINLNLPIIVSRVLLSENWK